MTTNATPAPLKIEISDEAAVHVKQFAIAEGKPNADIRVGVKGGGCSGLTYILEIVENGPSDTDKVIEENGVKLYVDKKSYVFLAGTVLEYSGGLNGKGFVFNNPNAQQTCGCGSSFGT